MSDTVSWLIAGPFMYLAILVFLAATLKKVMSIAKMPRHLRWDLYPVAHEGPEGSAYQKVEFWNRPRSFSVVHELAEMVPEMVLLKRTFLYNRRMWNFSFPMHFGLYLMIGWLVLLKIGVLVQLTTGFVISSASTVLWAQVLNALTVILGAGGLVMGLFGTAGLLWLRLTDEELKDFSAPVTFFNLYLLLGLFAVGFAAFVIADPSFSLARAYLASLITFQPMTGLPALLLLELLLLGAFLAYLPFSRMLHFAAKYFFYHNVMWDDEPVVRGGGLEKAIGGYLHYRVDWSASHIKPEGSWLEQATTNPTRPGQEDK